MCVCVCSQVDSMYNLSNTLASISYDMSSYLRSQETPTSSKCVQASVPTPPEEQFRRLFSVPTHSTELSHIGP